jgi:2-polyprenyl-6-methoxyphenol hydroxylase-like FAD-dependent oxidoreductase
MLWNTFTQLAVVCLFFFLFFQLNPAGGVGPANAVQDAIVLANLINGLPFHPIAEEIEAAFKAYQEERMPWVKDAHKISQTHRTMVGQVRIIIPFMASVRLIGG